ncbi:MAG: type II secretion system F family protein [Candidatus Aenigmarchaeota archaeon]|nr:type II secretion system F family protein [Candidatus Aenigmarchaeota archaeon]
MISKKYVKISYKFFGNFAKMLQKNFLDIRDDLQRANMQYTLEEYLSTALCTITWLFVVETAVLSFIFAFFVPPMFAVLSAFILSIAIAGMIFFLFYIYPATIAKSRENMINKVLPFAISYISAVASGKTTPITFFKTLSQFKEYGEVSKEAEDIVRDVEMFGMSAATAIRRKARRTPSEDLKEILYGMTTMISSGGDLGLYLRGKANDLMNDQRRKIMKFSNDLSFLVEIYLTLIIAGSIFFIVLSSVMAAISGGLSIVMLQIFIVMVLLPLISIAFIVLVKSMSPTG